MTSATCSACGLERFNLIGLLDRLEFLDRLVCANMPPLSLDDFMCHNAIVL